MPLYRASLQTLGATVLLALALACGGKSNTNPTADTTTTISGTVTFTRVPLAKDADGVPTGLKDETVAANLQTLPAKGVTLRAYQKVDQTNPDGTTAQVWVAVRSGLTDDAGAYSLTVTKNRPTMIEVLSSFYGGTQQINLVAEPGGISSATSVLGNSTTPISVLDRARFALRKAADGTAPANNNVPTSIITTASVVNFSVGLHDEWWVVNPSFNLSNSQAPLVTEAVLETSLPGRTAGLGSGSRILAVGDSIATFRTIAGDVTPGAMLDLHYWPGRTEPRGTYIDYDRAAYLSRAYDTSSGTIHFFGSISGGPTNDDAWDEGVLLPMLGRAVLFAGTSGRTFSVPFNPLLPNGVLSTDLSPGMARIEGLADAMAANVLKSPYLADTQGTGLAAPVKDVRVTGVGSAQLNPYSAPALRAFAWEIILKANSLPSPGVAADWSTINPLAASRFFLAPTALTQAAGTTAARDLEPLNIYSQMNRLKEVKLNVEPVDLATVFTDSVLTALATPFGIDWPRPTTGEYAVFVADWGTDPTGALPSVPLTMSTSTLAGGLYPNLSRGEVHFAGFVLNTDKRCVLTATITPALLTGGAIDVDVPLMQRTFAFSGSGGSTEPILIPVFATAPVYHPVRILLKSPSVLQPDVTVTLTLTPTP